MIVRRRLLVMSSTYPRWAGDHEPGFVHELTRRLLDRFEVCVLCPHSPGAARDELLDGVRVIRYRYAPGALEVLVNNGGIINNLRRRPWLVALVPGFLLAQLFVMWRLIRQLRPHVIHAHWLIPQGLLAVMHAASGLRTPPIVVTSHGADLFSLRAAPWRALKRWVIRRAAAVTVVSEGMREAVGRDGADASRIVVAPMGVDLTGRFVPDPSTAPAAEEILFVGRLVEKKGLRVLLDALPAVLRQRPHARLRVVGFGPELAARRQQAIDLGIGASVEFVGAVPQRDLPSVYRRAAVFVAPFVEASNGDQEGLGLVTIEAVGCGVPVVISELPSTRELLALPGVHGVPPGDESALAAAVLAVLALPPDAAQRDAARRRCFEIMDWAIVADLYGHLLGSHAADWPASSAAKPTGGG